MADPFSIIAGTIGIADVGVRLVLFLIEVKKGSDAIDDELGGLIKEINSLNTVSNLIHENFSRDLSEDYDPPSKDEQATNQLWSATGNALRDCKETLDELELLVKKMRGDGGSSTVDKLQKYFRKLFKEKDLLDLWKRLSRGQHLLQILLTASNITYTRKSQELSDQSFTTLSSSIRALGTELHSQIDSLRGKASTATSTIEVLAAAESIGRLASLNIHFMIPRSVSSTFTGRRAYLDGLKQAYNTSSGTKTSKRFVVYGLGGSGKTQFCCKFAQDNRQEFWGVFYVDASTVASTKSSYAEIAEKARIEPNERSVKYWLCGQKRPWLLLVDNVDDRTDPSTTDSYFPECEYGLVLLTTRNHSLRMQGNLEPRFYEFKGLGEEESVDLLLTTAGQRPPFLPKTLGLGKEICSALGFLPLALVQAGTAILKGQCTPQTCLAFFEKSWARVRETMHNSNRPARDSMGSNEIVFSTYEMIFPAASEDAIELLKLFSFLHRQRLRFEVLVQAVLKPHEERMAEKEARPQHQAKTKSWGQTGRDFIFQISSMMASLGDRKVLPKIFQAIEGLERDDVEFRLREILSELRGIALVDFVEEDNSYSIHPLVHWWTRESMPLREQAVWCQMACNVLANATLLPPLGAREGEAQLRRHTLAHIDHVREQEQKIQHRLRLKQKGRRRPWPVLQRAIRGPDIRQYAKFSLVYAESGQWDTALELMLVVDDFLCRNVGLGHPIAIRARLFLSGLYWLLGKADEAASLQFELLEACQKSRGEDDIETLKVMDQLAVSFWQRGKFLQAKEYHHKALEGFQDMHAADPADLIRAMTHLGQALGKLAEYDEAVNFHEAALEKLRQDQSPGSHDWADLSREVLTNLAMSLYDRHRYGHPRADDLTIAEASQAKVVVERERELGKQHPLTLWGYCNLARIKAALGMVEEAEDIIRTRLPIAERNLGETHIGVLFGKAQFGHILILRNKLSEAEVVLTQVVLEHERTNKDHPDQLVAAAFLVECYKRQEKYAEAIPLQEKVISVTRRIFGDGSPWEKIFVDRYQEQR